MSNLKRTPLFDAHQRLGARMVPFGGWEMPVQYSGLAAEHRSVRNRVGIFDISHMGKYMLSGPDLLAQLQRLVPSDLGKLKPGDACYTLLLNEQGGIIDDVIFYCRGPRDWFLIVNGATNEKDRRWLEDHLEQVEFEDRTTSHTLIALQGPAAAQTLQALVEIDLGTLSRFQHVETSLLGRPAFIARTGYTGEDGFEIMTAAADGLALWQAFIEGGVLPCGLGARDTLRLEAAMHLYGQDMDESTTPLEASLAWVIDWEKPEFIGRAVLHAQKESGITRRLVGFEVHSRQIARHGYPVWSGGEPAGTVTSGTLPPTLDRPIGLAYVKTPVAIGSPIEVEIRGKRYAAQVVRRPFYRPNAS